MQILVKNQSLVFYSNIGRCFTVELECGKHSVIVLVKAEGHLQVIVQNASNKCWRGMGKHFDKASDAFAQYKTAAIREMIAEAIRLSDAAPQTQADQTVAA